MVGEEVRSVHAQVGLSEYSLDLRLRIVRATIKATEAARKAWLLGVSSVNGDTCYEVYSSNAGITKKDGGPYYVRLHDDASMGGFVYALHGSKHVVWLRCSCMAAEHGNPCWHAAKVQLRIEREGKYGQAKGD